MRQAGTLSNRDQAQCLADYLLTQGISTRVEPDGNAWALWVREEDHLSQATRELQEYLAEPQASRYQQAAASASSVRKQQARDEQLRRKNFVEMRDRWDTRPTGRKPLTMLLIGLCVVVAIVSEAGEKLDSPIVGYLWFAPPRETLNFLDQLSWTPTKWIDAGQCWRLVTPIFIHFDPMHLIFNMYWLYLFGSLIEIRRGSLRYGLLVLTLAAASNYGQYLFPYRIWPLLFPHDKVTQTTAFGGMSGVVYGLLGYLWMKSWFQPQLKLFVSNGIVLFLVGWLVLGWTGLLDQLVGSSVANWAHTVGLLAGMAVGFAPVAWRRATGK